ncbi:MAG: type I secretion system permease/ATPase, partial [Arcobacter sp.]|nr:type I secretion system permease/ATPase [Arcobacter sp.]
GRTMNDIKRLSTSLFNNFLLFCKRYNKEVSSHSLLEDIPLAKNEDIPNMFSFYQGTSTFEKIALKGGFKAKIIEKKFKNISSLFLPAIIVLKDKTSCILESIDFSNGTAVIYVQDDRKKSFKDVVELEKLEKLYANRIFLLKKEYPHSSIEANALEQNNQHWFWGVVKKNISIYKDVIIASILINFFVLATPFFVMNVYDRVVPTFAVETLWALVIGICIIYIFDMTTKFIRAYYIDICSKKIDIIVSSKLYDKILNIKLEHKPKSVGSFASNIKDFELIKNFFSSSSIAVLVDMPFVVLFLVAVFYISGNIVVVPAIFIFLVLFYSLLIKKPLHNSIEASNEAVAYKNGILIESLNGLETLKSLGSTNHLRWKWEESTADISAKSIFTKMLTTSVTNINAFFIQLNTIFVVIYGVYAISENTLSLGGLIAAVILSSRAIAPMAQFASLLSNYEQAKTSYKMIENIMNIPDERTKAKSAIHKEKIKGNIECRNLSFSYDENKKVLDDISFSIKEGEKVAIIGKIGTGKSTIMKLLMKLYEAKEGELMLDGIEIKQIQAADIRKNIAYVSQDSLLFNGTLKDNILYKYPNASDEKLLKVTKQAQLLDFVNSHPQGFDMSVGERGDTLSGGQKKAISLARALVGDYSILLLDEPTDSMDSGTEIALLNALKDEIKDKTVILTTHKQSMLALVDRIILMDNSKIILDGQKDYVLNAIAGK